MPHTPGPRTVDRDDGENGEIYYAVHGAGYDFVANFDNRADAVLDAAAPDLLAALKAVVKVADRQTYEFDLARAAIAKAETV